jgi:hypothetical protein
VRSRFTVLSATRSVASMRVKAASARLTAAAKGAGSIWKSDWPAVTASPSANMRSRSNPPTWGRTSATRKGAVRPGRTDVTWISRRSSVITVTATGAGAALFAAARVGCSSQPAVPDRSAPRMRSRDRPRRDA